MGTTNILDLNNRVNALEKAGLTALDVAYDNTTSGLTATDVQGAVDELIADKIIYIHRQVTNFQLQNEWWGLYTAEANTDISSLALQNIPTIVSAIFVPSVSGTAWVMMNPSTTTNISVTLVRPGTQGSVTGEIIIGIKSNG